MPIPPECAEKHISPRNQDVTLRVGKKIWTIRFTRGTKGAGRAGILCGGWRKFVFDNTLDEFDVCLFKLALQKDEPVVLDSPKNVENESKMYSREEQAKREGARRFHLNSKKHTINQPHSTPFPSIAPLSAIVASPPPPPPRRQSILTMPLLKRTPFTLIEPPKDLDPDEQVFQVRFTKEIFRDYKEYLKRINLYRQRLWTCKVTAKGNLTYEEALVSEQQAMEKVQQFPVDLIGPVLRIIQYSTLPLIDLVNLIREKMMDPLAVGVELSGKRNGSTCPCRIVEVLEEKEGKTKYKVAWLEEDHKSKGSAIVSEDDLIRKKLPFTRSQLKSFIRESTYRNAPWVIHNKLALKYGISTEPPEELQSKVCFLNGCVVNKKRKEIKEGEEKNHKRNRVDNGASEDSSEVTKEHIKHPIDDLLVQHSAGDPVFSDRPSPSTEFSVPVECVGDLLMVWDFCTSFSKLLELSPFSLEYLEKAICHKESNTNLIVETHASLLRLLIKDEGDYYAVFKDHKRRPKITLVTWTDNLCDFLEMIEIPAFTTSIATIKRGHYGLLDAQMKLRILHELVNNVLATNLVKATLDEGIERWQALASSKREEALEDGRKRREAKERLKTESEANGANGPLPGTLYSVGNNLDEATKKHLHSNGNGAVETSSLQKHSLENGDGEHEDDLRKMTKQLMEEMEKNKEQRKEDLQREMEKRLIRTNPLGKDRDHNRYWFFRRDGRVFVESSDFESWGYYSSSEELDAFMGFLNPKGERENALKKQLERHYNKICVEMQKRNKENAQRSAAEEAELRRSSRVRAPPRENPALAFLKYVNHWKGD
ncbi:hypothetical protein Droror1_Dr00002072 [Drosera rotundifolia]